MGVVRLHQRKRLGVATVFLVAIVIGATSAATSQTRSDVTAWAATGLAPSIGNESRANAGGSPEWVDVDETVPTVASGVPCALPEVLRSAGERVKELITNLPQFTATERLEHQERDKAGRWSAPETVVFHYLAELREIRPGMLTMDEMRNGSRSEELFPAKLADFGLPALVLVFHPYFSDEYSITCEGLGEWKGAPAWQVRFQQRSDRAARLRAYVSGSRAFAEKLKGRAWIAADSYEVVHLEADLLEPIPEVRLMREHLAVEYRPVRFPKHDVQLWLPDNAQVYLNVRGRFFHRSHSFSNYLLFSVDVNQKIAGPKP